MIAWFQQLSTYLLVINLIFAVAVVFLERKNASVTWSWLMVLLFIPILGFVLYIIFGQNLSRRKLYKWRTRYYETRSAQLTEQADKLKHNLTNFNTPEIDAYRDLVYLNVAANRAPVMVQNDIELFTDGRAKFDRLLYDISQAKHHINMQYYIITNDQLGRIIVEALTKKAREGVIVRLLYDAIGSRALKKSFFADLKAAGGLVAAFFPSKIPYFNLRLNYRNHRKLVIIDGQIGFTGGFNVGNEYLGLSKRFGFWRDTHLRITGVGVHALQELFLLDWNLSSDPNHEFDHRYFPDPQASGDVTLQIVSGGPNQQWSRIENMYLKMIASAKSSIYLQSPYFIPDESLLSALRVAALSGIDIKIMIPLQSDHLFVHWASLYYVGELMQAGITCYLYDQGFLHAKMIIIDGKIATVGTANFDIRSLKLNFETNVIIYDKETASRLQSIYINDIKRSQLLTLEQYENRSRWTKLKESVSKLVSPLL